MDKTPSLAEILSAHGYQDAEHGIRESVCGLAVPMNGRRVKVPLKFYRYTWAQMMESPSPINHRTHVEAWIDTDETGHWRMLATIPGSGVTVCLETGRRRR